MVPLDSIPVVHPRIAELRGAVERCEDELARLLLTSRELSRVRLPYARIVYERTIGHAELSRTRASILMLRARRTLELIRAATIRGATPDYAGIEHALDEELRAHYERVAAKAHVVKEALKTRFEYLDPANEAEAKRIYRKLVIKLHPDTNPTQSAVDVERWHQMLEAYDACDLDALRALEVAAIGREAVSREVRGTFDERVAALEAELSRLETRMQNEAETIARMRDSSPYCLLESLEDPAWVDERLAAIAREIEDFDAATKAYEAASRELKKETDDDDGPLLH